MPLPLLGIPLEPPPLGPPEPASTAHSLDDVPPPQSVLLGGCGSFQSQPNTFGLFHVFDEKTLPFHDPDDSCGENPLAQAALLHNEAEAQTLENPFHPYPNESSFHLGDWYWNQGSQKSRTSFRKLLDIIGWADFQPEDVQATSWTTIDRTLGALDLSGDGSQWKVSEEWLNNDAGWKCMLVTISVPFP